MEKPITVQDAVLMAYKAMPNEFHVLLLCERVRVITGRIYLMDATITRKLRVLRQDCVVNYEPDEKNHVYRKINSEPVQLGLFN